MTNTITKKYLIEKSEMQEVMSALYVAWFDSDIIFGVDESIDLFTDLIILQFDSSLLKNKTVIYLLELLDFWRQR
jgi:hypothetical protein